MKRKDGWTKQTSYDNDMHGDNEMILDLDSIKSTGLSAIVVNKSGTTKKMYP